MFAMGKDLKKLLLYFTLLLLCILFHFLGSKIRRCKKCEFFLFLNNMYFKHFLKKKKKKTEIKK